MGINGMRLARKVTGNNFSKRKRRKKCGVEIPRPNLRICFTHSDELLVFQCPSELRQLIFKALKPWNGIGVTTWEVALTPAEVREWKKLTVVFGGK